MLGESVETEKIFNSRKQIKLIQLTLMKHLPYTRLCSLAKVQRKVEMRYSKIWKLLPGDVLGCLKEGDRL